jgi:hypothetical protein
MFLPKRDIQPKKGPLPGSLQTVVRSGDATQMVQIYQNQLKIDASHIFWPISLKDRRHRPQGLLNNTYVHSELKGHVISISQDRWSQVSDIRYRWSQAVQISGIGYQISSTRSRFVEIVILFC